MNIQNSFNFISIYLLIIYIENLPDKLIGGASSAYLGMAAFVIIAALLYGSSIAIFNKRDLHR